VKLGMLSAGAQQQASGERASAGLQRPRMPVVAFVGASFSSKCWSAAQQSPAPGCSCSVLTCCRSRYPKAADATVMTTAAVAVAGTMVEIASGAAGQLQLMLARALSVNPTTAIE
jgi:hypothetical protein